MIKIEICHIKLSNLFTIAFVLFSSKYVNSQSQYVVWNSDGKFLFQEFDSLKLLKKMGDYLIKNTKIEPKADKTFFVMSNGQSTLDYSKVKIVDASPFNLRNFSNDSILNAESHRDSFIDGKWLVYSQFEKLELALLKEVKNYRLINTFIKFGGTRENDYLTRNFSDKGYPVGTLILFRNNRKREEVLFKDSLNFKVYKKIFDELGQLYIHEDYVKGYKYQLFPNGQINVEVKIDKYGTHIMPFYVYDDKGFIIEVRENKIDDPFVYYGGWKN